MTQAILSEAAGRDLALLRDKGCEVFGPGPVTPGQTTPTPDARTTLPGMHVQIRCAHRFVEGFGATADEAVADAIAKLDGYDPARHVPG